MFLLFGILSNPDCKSYDLEYGIANPVQRENDLMLQTNGEWEGYKILDVQGRLLSEGKGFKHNLHLQTKVLPNGLYRIILAGKKETKSANFQILK